MTNLKKLARTRGLTLVQLADILGLTVPQVRHSALTHGGQYDFIKGYLLRLEKVDVSLINQIMRKHDIHIAEIARRCNVNRDVLTKIRNGRRPLTREIHQKLKELL